MSDGLDQELKNHEYDGIKEYDNPLPNWWLVTFFGTIIFAFIYWVHYEIAGGPTLDQELELAMADLKSRQGSVASKAESESDLEALMQDPSVALAGVAPYNGKCAACHGQELQGLIGPNLVDSYWIHGKGTRVDIVGMIRKGVPEKGMPPWQGMMKEEEIYAVAAYILSKKGSRPANAKAPQGEKVD